MCWRKNYIARANALTVVDVCDPNVLAQLYDAERVAGKG